MSSGGAIGRGVAGLSADTLRRADGTVEIAGLARERMGGKGADSGISQLAQGEQWDLGINLPQDLISIHRNAQSTTT